MASGSSNSPCAACKFLRRKCTPGCVFAPHFPPDQPSKFANVHRVFGASNVAKLLNELTPGQREDAVNSLAYEAEARLRDPVYGCVGYISNLQYRLGVLQRELINAKKELSSYIGPTSSANPFLTTPVTAAGLMNPFHHQQHSPTGAAANLPTSPSPSSVVPYGTHPHAGAAAMGLGLPHTGASPSAVLLQDHQYQQQQIMEAQRLAAAREHQEMLRVYHHQHQQHDLLRFGGGIDGGGGSGGDGHGGAVSGGFNYLGGVVSVAGLPSSLALATQALDNPFHSMEHHPHHREQQHQQETRHPDQRRVVSDEGRSGGGGGVAGPGLSS